MNQNKIYFTKMHGLGNDFVIIDAVHQKINLSTLPISLLGNRHFGIGFDQLIIIEAAKKTSEDFFCRIFNADGSEAEQCGNGLRCAAKFIFDHALKAVPNLQLATKAGVFSITLHDNDQISMQMGVPKIIDTHLKLTLSDDTVIGPLCIISMGNPHAILLIKDLLPTEIIELGTQISTHPYFETGINAGLMQVIDSAHIRLRTIERGSGETYACGSNACAAAATGILLHGLDRKVIVEFQYGSLIIDWPDDHTPITMTGPAVTVFSGYF